MRSRSAIFAFELAASCLLTVALAASANAARFTGLGYLLGGQNSSGATAVSPDGSVIVGHSESASGIEAFRWTSNGGMVGLGDLPGGEFYSSATGVSADGSVISGVGHSRSNPRAHDIYLRARRKPFLALFNQGAQASGHQNTKPFVILRKVLRRIRIK